MKKLLTILIAFAPVIILAQTPEERLENSPRHQEWVEVKNGDKTVHSFLVYPEVEDNVPAVIVIHENRGLNNWARGLTDQVAERGYIAIAPDLLSGTGPDGGKTSDFTTSDDARAALYKLDPDQITSDLNAVREYVKNLPSCNGKVVVIGFCWGGSQTFRYATNQDGIEAALVCYGTGPKTKEEIDRIEVPVYGFYGGNDNRVNATISQSEEWMKASSNTYDYQIYEGAGHGFMRSGERADASEANKKAREEAWKRIEEILKKL